MQVTIHIINYPVYYQLRHSVYMWICNKARCQPCNCRNRRSE